MKRGFVRRMLAIGLATTLTLTVINPNGFVTERIEAAEQEQISVLRKWNFESTVDGWYYGGTDWEYQYHGGANSGVSYDADNQRLKVSVDYSKDKDSSWSQLAACYYEDGMSLTGANNITFDFYYDASKKTQGAFSVKLFSNSGIDVYQTVNEEDAQTVSGTIKKVSMSIDFDAISSATSNDLSFAIIGVNTDYCGDIFLDDITICNKTVSNIEEETIKEENFDDGIDGWYYAGGWEWQYSGSANSSISAEDGKMKITADFSADGAYNWSNFAVAEYDETGFDLKGATTVTADVYYNTEAMDGSFMLGVYANDASGTTAIDAYAQPETVDADSGLTHAVWKLTFDPVALDKVQTIAIKVIGSNTTYQGDLLIDNLKFTRSVDKSDINVDATVLANAGNTVTIASGKLITTAKDGNEESTTIPSNVKLVDSNADANTVGVYEYLSAMGNSSSVIYGHQNDTWHKAGALDTSNSDTFDVTGQYAGVVGIDALSLTGNEYSATRYNAEIENSIDMDALGREKANVVAAAKLTNRNIANGSIITLSAHMPNFSVVNENDDYVEGQDPTYAKYDFTGYSPNTLTGDVANEILPGGQYNDQYKAYLDMIADYADMVDGTILFRPFHEGTGSWFWWGAAFCNEETFKNIYRYTVNYLRDEKNVHNMLYLYGPSSDASSTEEYEARYPGDEYVDIVGFDMYDLDPVDEEETTYFNNFRNELSIVDTFATEHNKLMAVTETGLATSAADAGENQTVLHKTGNVDKDWYNKVLECVADTNASYFMLWANFGKKDGFYTPYVERVSDGVLHGHETLDNFITFYNDNRSVFAGDQQAVLSDLETSIASQITSAQGVNEKEYGYITSPIAGKRVLDETIVTAQIVNNQNETVSFVIKAGDKSKTLNAVVNNNVATAQLRAEDLKALGECAEGKITLMIGEEAIQTIGVILNIAEPEQDKYEIDGFENYYGVDSLLTKNWSINKDTGCTVSLTLTDDENKAFHGSYAMKFSYKETSNGWGGATISKEVDWSDCNALQFYTIPDGNNQKVVIQLTASGTVYEAYLNLYQDYAADKDQTPLLVTIPFTEFVQRDTAGNPAGGLVNDCGSITSFGLWVNAIPDSEAIDEDGMVTGVIYYDKITAVNVDQTEATFVSVKEGAEDAGNHDSKPEKPNQNTSQNEESINHSASKETESSANKDADEEDKVVTPTVSKEDNVVIESTEGTYVKWKFAKMEGSMDKFNPMVTVGADLKDVKAALDKLELPSNMKYVTVDFEFDGKLPAEAEVTLDVSKAKFAEGAIVYLYYYNPDTQTFELIDSSKCVAGYATFKMTHCSEYIITDQKLPESKVTASPITGDANNATIFIILVALGAVFVTAVMKKKKQA